MCKIILGILLLIYILIVIAGFILIVTDKPITMDDFGNFIKDKEDKS